MLLPSQHASVLRPRGAVSRARGSRRPCVAVHAAGPDGLNRPQRKPMAPSHLPKVVAFDLDGTLWYPEMYMLNGGAPFRKDASGNIYDSAGEQIRLIGASAAILRELATDPKWKGTEVAYVSRTEYPEWAIPLLKTIEVAPGVTMFGMSAYQEIFPGSKRTHFKNIHKGSGVAYVDMIFFDNERWNCTDCEPMGITCIYTPNGMTASAWQDGLAKFAKRAVSAK